MELSNISKRGMDTFNTFLKDYPQEVNTSKIDDNYYNMLIDAYSKGYEQGGREVREEAKKQFADELKEKFVEKANKIYLTSKTVGLNLKANGFKTGKLYIDIFQKTPKVIISVDEDSLLDDQKTVFAYSLIHKSQRAFYDLFSATIDLSLVSYEDLDENVLAEDGFLYNEEIK